MYAHLVPYREGAHIVHRLTPFRTTILLFPLTGGHTANPSSPPASPKVRRKRIMPPASLLRFASIYNANFDRRPIPTLIITNGILNTIADALVRPPFSSFSFQLTDVTPGTNIQHPGASLFQTSSQCSEGGCDSSRKTPARH